MAAISAATVVAGISAATALTGTTMSFIQAGQAKAKAADATKAADKAIAEAKSKLDLNFYDALGIQKEPYELQREALLASGAQAIEAGRESERGAAATAGRVQMAQNEAQAGVRTQMGQDLMALEKLSAAEASRLRDVGAQINLEEVAGAQLASADFNSMAGRATTQAMQGIVQTGEAVGGFVPLYMKSRGIDPNTGLKIVPPAKDKTTQGVAETNTKAVQSTTATPATTQDNNVAVAQAATPTGATVAGVADLSPMANQEAPDINSMGATAPVTQAATTPAPAPAPAPNTQSINPASIDPIQTVDEINKFIDGDFLGVQAKTPSNSVIEYMGRHNIKWNPTKMKFEL
jgi:hypothetical protein